jgi:proteasome beta subunit
MAGDRQASEGYQVASRNIAKVIPVDRHSCVSIAGAAGPAMDLARLFRVEIEHYEKLEGVMLTTDGKANKLAQMVREALPMAMQGLVVVPLFAGFDPGKGTGRIYKYDPAGGRYEEDAYYANGSGGLFARNTLKMLYREEMTQTEAVEAALRALYEAADEDLGTGGPDFVREIYPTVFTMDSGGTRELSPVDVARYYRTFIDTLKRKG